MKVTVWWRAFNSRSDNRQAAPETKIANLISAGFVAIAFSFCATVADAQQPGKAARIGYLDGGTAAGSAELLDAFRKQMTQLDWIEGKNLTIEYRYAEGQGANRFAELAVELARLKLDLIVVNNTGLALAAQKATSTIPIVMTTSIDPVAQGTYR
jgi:putative ABC transport system substrate-binding protein